MYTLLFGAVLLFGAIFGFGYLIKWFIEEIIPNFENHNFPSLLAICAGITFAATFLIVFLFWFWTVICFELNDISPLGSGEDFSFIKTVNISVVFMMIALIVLTSIKIRYIYTNNKIILYYCIFAVLVSLIASMFVNIILNNYIWKVFSIIPLLIGILSFVVSVILFTYLNSVDRKNRILREYITRINARIKSAMLIAENFLNENNVDNLNKRKYNKLRKNANKYLTKKSAYKTFQPVFEEDKIVLKTVALFKTLSCKALEDKYKQYKKFFITTNQFKLLQRANRKAVPEFIINETKEFAVLLSGVLKNNESEIQSLSVKREHILLYKKYNVFQYEKVKKKYIVLSCLEFCALIATIILNIYIKL